MDGLQSERMQEGWIKVTEKFLCERIVEEFRKDGFSKDVYIVQSDFGHNERILQSRILSEYKQLNG